MKKIYINNTKHAIFFGDTMLLPGSNVAEEIDAEKYPGLESRIEEGEIDESDDPASAMKNANTEGAVDDLENLGKGDGKVGKAAEKRRGQLGKMKAEAKEAMEAAKKASEEEKGESGKEE